jgi:hypothetical protein
MPRRLALPSIFSVALLLGLACGDSAGGTGETGACTVGSAGCPCTAGGGCDPGLTCASDTCVDLSGLSSSGAPAPTTGGTTGGPGGETEAQTATGAPTTDTGAPPTTDDPATSDATTDGPKLDVGMDTTTGAPAGGCRKVDVLFALDGSGSMLEERSALAAADAFADIVDTLSGLNGGGIDYRIAVTTDNDDGFINPPCWQEPDPWVSSVGHTPGEVADAFECAVSSFGTNNFEASVGCEHVLTSATDLLDGDASGFVRDDALLVLVLVTDVDDYGAYDQQDGNLCNIGCNTPPPPLAALHQRLVDDVKGGEADGLAAIVVAGDPGVMAGMNFCGQPGSCGCNGFDCGVFHATRLYEFAGRLGMTGVAADICGGADAVPDAVASAFQDGIDLACQEFDPPQ